MSITIKSTPPRSRIALSANGATRPDSTNTTTSMDSKTWGKIMITNSMLLVVRMRVSSLQYYNSISESASHSNFFNYERCVSREIHFVTLEPLPAKRFLILGIGDKRISWSSIISSFTKSPLPAAVGPPGPAAAAPAICAGGLPGVCVAATVLAGTPCWPWAAPPITLPAELEDWPWKPPPTAVAEDCAACNCVYEKL